MELTNSAEPTLHINYVHEDNEQLYAGLHFFLYKSHRILQMLVVDLNET